MFHYFCESLYAKHEQSYVFFFFYFFSIREWCRCVRSRPGRFKGPDPAEWPRSILGSDRMLDQDEAPEATQPWTEPNLSRPFRFVPICRRSKGRTTEFRFDCSTGNNEMENSRHSWFGVRDFREVCAGVIRIEGWLLAESLRMFEFKLRKIWYGNSWQVRGHVWAYVMWILRAKFIAKIAWWYRFWTVARSMEMWEYFEKIVRNSIMKFGRIYISYDRLSGYVKSIKFKIL